MSWLMDQIDARKKAKERNEKDNPPAGYAYIAHAYPETAWGGQEKGWVVTLKKI